MSAEAKVRGFVSSGLGVSQNEWSGSEKAMICMIQEEAPVLPYPLTRVCLPNGTMEDMYNIPEDKVAEVVRSLWPFAPAPAVDKEFVDIHCDKQVKVSELKVIRHNNRNIVVSKYYQEAGGTVMDLVEPEVASNTLVQMYVPRDKKEKAKEDSRRVDAYVIEIEYDKKSATSMDQVGPEMREYLENKVITKL